MTKNDAKRWLVACHTVLLLGVAAAVGHGPLLASWGLRGEWVWSARGGVLIGQISLVALWAALSERALRIRLLTIVLVIPGLAILYSNIAGATQGFGWWITDSRPSAERHIHWIAALGTLAVFIFAGGSGLRWLGAGLKSENAASSPPRWRFGMRDLFAWVTCVALVCGTGSWLATRGFTLGELMFALRQYPLRPPQEFAALALVSAVLIVSPWPRRYTLPTLAGLAIAQSYMDAHFINAWTRAATDYPMPWTVYASSTTAFAITVWSSLWWCRQLGYRLAWNRRSQGEAEVGG